MGLLIEALLRGAKLTDEQRKVCLRGIAQMAMADGVEDPRERAYLNKFVDEFFEGADPTNDEYNIPITKDELAQLDTTEAKECFAAYLYTTAYIDEDFSPEEEKYAEEMTDGLVDSKRRDEIINGVREFLYRRSVFAYAFRFNKLDEEFARAMAQKFQLNDERAVDINATVFNAIMAMKGPHTGSDQAEAET